MAINCRELKSGRCEITQKYKGANHKGIDMVGAGYTTDYVVAHSDGTVVAVVADCNRNTSQTGEKIYGNYVKIRHDDGYYTLYAHLKYGTVAVANGQRVSRGQTLGYMGNTGYSFGAHLHWEVRNTNDQYIDPTPYLDSDLPGVQPEPTPPPTPTYKYKVGDVVTINGVYTNSQSTNKLIPAVKTGTITKVLEGARNPYLLNNGNIGWVNDECIVDSQPGPTPQPTGHYIGQVVRINGVYTSSTSTKKLVPAVKEGTITKILTNGARNPYLLNNGNIGWVNDGCIIG